MNEVFRGFYQFFQANVEYYLNNDTAFNFYILAKTPFIIILLFDELENYS
jgi:hypothetical protein